MLVSSCNKEHNYTTDSQEMQPYPDPNDYDLLVTQIVSHSVDVISLLMG